MFLEFSILHYFNMQKIRNLVIAGHPNSLPGFPEKSTQFPKKSTRFPEKTSLFPEKSTLFPEEIMADRLTDRPTDQTANQQTDLRVGKLHIWKS